MKVLFCSSSFRGGGITSYAIEVLRYLSIENEVSVIIGDDSLYPLANLGIKVYKKEATNTSLQNAEETIHLINHDIRPDLIINSNSKLISLITPFLSDSIRVVSVSHSLKYKEADIATISHRYMDSVIALSISSKNYLVDRFHIKDEGKIKVLYNFVHSIEGVKEYVETKKRAACLNIVYMGGSSGAKSPDIVYKVLRELQKTDLPFVFSWLGESTIPMKRIQFARHVQDYLIEDARIVFYGRVPRDRAIDIASRANILLIPSRREGCPMALLETIRYGVITITADFKTACSEIIVNGDNGFIIPAYSIRRYVDLICDIINNHKKYSYIYDSSVATFSSMLSYDIWKKKMDELLVSPICHKRRLPHFNKTLYCYLRFKLWCLNIDNKVDWFYREALRAAIPFQIEYLKKHLFGFCHINK